MGTNLKFILYKFPDLQFNDSVYIKYLHNFPTLQLNLLMLNVIILTKLLCVILKMSSEVKDDDPQLVMAYRIYEYSKL